MYLFTCVCRLCNHGDTGISCTIQEVSCLQTCLFILVSEGSPECRDRDEEEVEDVLEEDEDNKSSY